MSARQYVMGASMRLGAPVHALAEWRREYEYGAPDAVTLCGRVLAWPNEVDPPHELDLCARCAAAMAREHADGA